VKQILADSFAAMDLPEDASAFLLKVWDIIQVLDDIKDGHPIEDVDGSIYTLLFGLATDEFFYKFRPILISAMLTAYYKWQAANVAEQSRVNLDKAYMWRAGYYDLILLVAALCLPKERVQELAPQILALYGETRDEYLKEFS
jgi:hypothetical protein